MRKSWLKASTAALAFGACLPASPLLAQDAPSQGGTIVVTYKDDMATLDPAIGYDWQNWSMINGLFSRLVDYKSGKSPGEGYEAKALFQMKFYALVIWKLRGVVPSVLQLIYLGNGEILRYEPDEDDLRATERKVEAVWAAIQRAHASGDWQPSPSRLCDWCSFRDLCPEWGGTPPPLPEVAPADPGELTAEDVD